MTTSNIGKLAKECCSLELPVRVLRSGAGFYIGCADDLHGPVSRESEEYWPTHELAQSALDNGSWNQRQQP